MAPAEPAGSGERGPADLLAHLATSLALLEIRYLVTGSMATIAYGEPRFTNDIDVVIALPEEKIDAFCANRSRPQIAWAGPAAVGPIRSRTGQPWHTARARSASDWASGKTSGNAPTRVRRRSAAGSQRPHGRRRRGRSSPDQPSGSARGRPNRICTCV